MEELLAKIEAAIQGLILPADAEMVEKVVVGGQRILYDESSHDKIFKGMEDMDTESGPQTIAVGVAALMTLMRGRKGFPDNVLAPASSLLMCDTIRFMTEAEMLEPTQEFIGNAFEELLALLMQKVGIGPEEIGMMIDERGQLNPGGDPVEEAESSKNSPPEAMPPQGMPPQGGLINGAAQ